MVNETNTLCSKAGQAGGYTRRLEDVPAFVNRYCLQVTLSLIIVKLQGSADDV